MSRITASGDFGLGFLTVEVDGGKAVHEIRCNSKTFADDLRAAVKVGAGRMANNYAPNPGTMLQAYAWLTTLFGADNVKVDGDIGTIPFEEGVIY